MAALAYAIESYKDDHGQYPTDPSTADFLKTATSFDSNSYIASSQFLYRALSGDSDGDPRTTSATDTRVYFDFRPQMLRPSPGSPDTYIVDPWGNSYGYSTFKMSHPDSHEGFNPTYDLWSTGGAKTQKDKQRWIRNW